MKSKRPYIAIIGITLLVGAAIVPFAALTIARKGLVTHPFTGQPVVTPGAYADGTLLHNGWKVTPAGRSIPTGDMLLGGAVSPDSKLLAIGNCGYTANGLHIVDLSKENELQSIPLQKVGSGIAWSPDGKRLYVAGAVTNTTNDIYVFERGVDGKFEQKEGFKLGDSVSGSVALEGMAISKDGQVLYALNTSDKKMYAINSESGLVMFGLESGDHPVTIRISYDGLTAFIANTGEATVSEIGLADRSKIHIRRKLHTGEHPNDIALAKDGRVFVSCGNSDEVDVFDPKTGERAETIRLGLTPSAPFGSQPFALALTPDNKMLYVANAGDNAVTTIDVSTPGKSRPMGMIPTGWFPTSVIASPDGKRIIVGNGKGSGTGPNPIRTPGAMMSFKHIGNQLNGSIEFINVPGLMELDKYSKAVLANSPYRDQPVFDRKSTVGNVIPTKPGDKSPIKYVLYIIKENRTYDQVFGDVKKGNGDPNLTLFGADVTPNHHALAEQFVLLDNLYCNGEVSQDGHPWCVSAYCTDFTQRSWVTSYSKKGQPVQGNQIQDPPGGYLWQSAGKGGLRYRSYGEYKGHPTLADHESLPFVGKGGPNMPAPGRDTERADIFIQEFKAYEAKGDVPNFMVMSLGEDHTRGTSVGAFTPKAAVASNDLALGKIVEAISHSSIWNECAIFVIEDDSQNGPDHVDSHRTAGLLISPYVKRGVVDSTMYQTASMIHTMEMILGLKPLSTYDAGATPMFASFTTKPVMKAYDAVPAKIDLNAKNGMAAFGAKESGRMDWSDFDRVDEQALNRILWKSIKGARSVVPAPVRSASVLGHIKTPTASPVHLDTD
ncbi:MAG: beta-propeller fold lactonase family protein [Chthonomonadales bacterium]